MLLTILVLSLVGFDGGEDSAADRFYEAYFNEIAESELRGPLAVYRSLLDEFSDDPHLRSWVRLRIAACELKLGNRAEAERYLELARESSAPLATLEAAIAEVTRKLDAPDSPPQASPPITGAKLRPVDPSVRHALDRGYAWLLQHQRGDGSWSAGLRARHGDTVDEDLNASNGLQPHDVGATALAVLALAVEANDSKRSEAIRRALAWLRAQQHRGSEQHRGYIGLTTPPQHNGEHALATLALLAGTEVDEAESEALALALSYVFRAQNQGFGWDYGFRSGSNNSYHTSWMAHVLLDAKQRAVVDAERVTPALAGAFTWFRRVRAVLTGRVGFVAPGDKGARLRSHPTPYPFDLELLVHNAAVLFLELQNGADPESPRPLEDVSRLVDSTQRPEWRLPHPGVPSSINFRHWYWGTLALGEFGGAPQREWNRSLFAALIPHQEPNGSWPPVGEWCPVGGRVYSTALALRCLQIASVGKADSGPKPKGR